jgi:hypothetical protein
LTLSFGAGDVPVIFSSGRAEDGADNAQRAIQFPSGIRPVEGAGPRVPARPIAVRARNANRHPSKPMRRQYSGRIDLVDALFWSRRRSDNAQRAIQFPSGIRPVEGAGPRVPARPIAVDDARCADSTPGGSISLTLSFGAGDVPVIFYYVAISTFRGVTVRVPRANARPNAGRASSGRAEDGADNAQRAILDLVDALFWSRRRSSNILLRRHLNPCNKRRAAA